jgi:hypothetical protein
MEHATGSLAQRKHRRFSPSQAERFIACPGSTALLARTTSRSRSKYALQGDLAHEVLAAGLKGQCENATQSIEASIYCGGVFETLYVDQLGINVIDFKASINDALNYVWQLMDDLNKEHGDAVMWVERYVDTPCYTAPGETGGFCDVAIYSAKARRLWVIDYKHGAGIAKAADGNPQVKQYAAGFLFEPGAAVDVATLNDVVLVIIQPRAFHPDGEIREAITTPSELADYLLELEDRVAASLAENAPLNPGIDQCRFCDAAANCPAIEAQSLKAANVAFSSVRDVRPPTLPDPATLDVDRLAYAKQTMPLLKMWMDRVNERAEQLLRSGVAIPGWKMVQSHARRQWFGEEADRANRLAALIGCEPTDLFETKFITITDAEKKIIESFKKRVARNKRKAAAEDASRMFAFFTTKETSDNLTLVSEDDPRPAVNKAAMAFHDVALLPPPTNGETK